MTIRKGEPWGTLRVPDHGLVVAESDARVAELAGSHTVIALAGGDLMRTLGGTGDRARFGGEDPIPHLPVDLIHVVADDERTATFIAHLVARGSWWRGEVRAIMNAQFLRVGRREVWDVAPRSHPNDGRVDIVTATDRLGVQQRWMARSRLRLGTHVPHPDITVRQVAEVTLELPSSTPLWLDGVRWGSARQLVITVEPDAFTVCV